MPKSTRITGPAVRDASKAIRFAENLGNVVLFSVDKPQDTAAIRNFLRARRCSTAILRCKPRTTAHEILRTLAAKFEFVSARSGPRVSGSELYELLAKQLSGGTTLLVLDEAHGLTDSAFRLLRDFYNDYRLPVLVLTDDDSATTVWRRMLKHLGWRSIWYPAGGYQESMRQNPDRTRRRVVGSHDQSSR